MRCVRNFFEQFKKCESVDSSLKEEQWLSWAQLIAVEGEAVAQAMVDGGTVITRQHTGLDHASAAVAALKPQERLQYSHASEKTVLRHSNLDLRELKLL